ncbi:FAD:protein FMN transferase [Gynuella sunshinyii]|uniref:FAD:protein FMN transferase n=1 Tax=Gynuella sunshinyii YC6258 TaxID=1445510 RepID=A0A0C5V4A5_9GAMM|nr:FAD:protein FMN transferase [Gynuella sunshinyii]AJQ94305.1 membrane-associated lipoprotein involved in thiamine biosynthesis [Gynuella sunshinyii YC6258]
MSSALPLHHHQFRAMGSRCELWYYAPAEDNQQLLAAARQRLIQLENKYTRYRPDSITSRINAASGNGEQIEVDSETVGLLHYAATLHEQSEGLFDITSGILRRAWDFRSGCLPADADIEALLPLIGWSNVHWQPPFFALPKAGMEIDFGGFVKEFAADQLGSVLRHRGVEHGLVNLGGDISVIGPHPDGKPWMVGIQHPREADHAIARIPMTHGAIATSGDYERYMLIGGKRYCHILNPFTGYPIQSPIAGATVVADQCLIAGSFTSLALLKSETDPDWLKESGVAYLLVDQQMSLISNIQVADQS